MKFYHRKKNIPNHFHPLLHHVRCRTLNYLVLAGVDRCLVVAGGTVIFNVGWGGPQRKVKASLSSSQSKQLKWPSKDLYHRISVTSSYVNSKAKHVMVSEACSLLIYLYWMKTKTRHIFKHLMMELNHIALSFEQVGSVGIAWTKTS